jgi:hypothetical protein
MIKTLSIPGPGLAVRRRAWNDKAGLSAVSKRFDARRPDETSGQLII